MFDRHCNRIQYRKCMYLSSEEDTNKVHLSFKFRRYLTLPKKIWDCQWLHLRQRINKGIREQLHDTYQRNHPENFRRNLLMHLKSNFIASNKTTPYFWLFLFALNRCISSSNYKRVSSRLQSSISLTLPLRQSLYFSISSEHLSLRSSCDNREDPLVWHSNDFLRSSSHKSLLNFVKLGRDYDNVSIAETK